MSILGTTSAFQLRSKPRRVHTAKNEKNRRFRKSRLESLEARWLLSATPQLLALDDPNAIPGLDTYVIEAQSGTVSPELSQALLLDTPPEPTAEQLAARDAYEALGLLPDRNGAPPDSDVVDSSGGDLLISETPAPLEAGTLDEPGDPAPQAPGTFQFFRNDPVATNGSASTVNEPTASNVGSSSLQTGNWYASVSGDYGESFQYINPYTTFGDVAGAGFCCDQRTVHDDSRNLSLWYLQYSKNGSTATSTGGVRIARAVGESGLLSGSFVSYVFTPASFALPAGRWMDFPDIEVTNNFLYATSNVYSTVTDDYTNTVLWRMPLNSIATGAGVTFNYWTTTTGTIGLASGGTTQVWGANLQTSTSTRIYRQSEANTTLLTNDIGSLNTTYFGTHNSTASDGTNWTGRADSRIQTGWVSSSEVGFMWNSAQGGSRPQPFVRSLVLNPSTLAVAGQPDLFNSNFAWHYPSVSANSEGDVAGVAFFGGPTISGVDTAVIIDDEFNGDPPPWSTVFALNGTWGDNNRWGDYTSSLQHEQFGNTWVAASYRRVGPSTAKVVEPYYFWFGREEDNPGPNLRGTSFNSAEPLGAGATFDASFRIINEGAATAGASTVSFYVSTNNFISTADRLLGTYALGALGAGVQTGTLTKQLTLPSNIDTYWQGNGDATYYIGMIVDSGAAVVEFDESDNRNQGNGIDRDAVAITGTPTLPYTWTSAVEGFAYFNRDGISPDSLSFDAFVNTGTDTDSFYFAGDSGWSGSYVINVGDFGNVVDPVVAVYDASTGAILGYDDNTGVGDDAQLTLNLSSLTRYIVVVADKTTTQSGDVSIRIEAPSTTAGQTISIGSDGSGTINGSLSPAADTDFYNFTAPAELNGDLTITVSPSATLDASIALFDSAGNQIAADLFQSVGTPAVINLTGQTPGTEYFLSVLPQDYDTTGSFTVDVDFGLLPRLLFAAKLPNGQVELFKSDGTTSGTRLLKNLGGVASSDPRDFVQMGDYFYFTAQLANGQRELFRTDGTSAGTGLLKNLSNTTSSDPRELTVIGNQLFFTAVRADGSRELFVSDGSAVGTTLLKNLAGPASSEPRELTAVGNTLFFSARLNASSNQRELFSSDGTQAGTGVVANLAGNMSSNPIRLTNVNGTLFYVARLSKTSSERELFKSDGTVSGTKLVRNYAGSLSSNPTELTAVGNTLFYVARTNVAGERELYMSDGTTPGTVLVKNLAGFANAVPRELTAVGNTLFFNARLSENSTNRELFRSDGTDAGTVVVKNILGPVNSNPAELTNVNGTLYFVARFSQNFNQRELYKSDGTAAGTVLVKNLAGTASSSPRNLTAVGNTLFFNARLSETSGQRELFMSDGTAATTNLVKNLSGNTSSNPSGLAATDFTLASSPDSTTPSNHLLGASVAKGASANADDLLDVNADGSVTAGDALLVINQMNRMLGGAEGEASPDLSADANGDGIVTALDALAIIYRLSVVDQSNVALPALNLSSPGLDDVVPAMAMRLESKDTDEQLFEQPPVIVMPDVVSTSITEGDIVDPADIEAEAFATLNNKFKVGVSDDLVDKIFAELAFEET